MKSENGTHQNTIQKWRDVRQDIRQTALQAGRDPENIQLAVITKGKSAGIIKDLVEAGQDVIGESYLKEALFKMDLLSAFDIEWHMVGHIQSGKATQVAFQFDCVHSVDRVELAELLQQGASEAGKKLPVFLECNVSGETTKHGFPAWKEENWEELKNDIQPILEMDNLMIRGLMTMAPYGEDPETARPYFQRLKELLGFLNQGFPQAGFRELSMGMSADYRIAIEEGATYLRIGSKIVGPRR